MMKTKGEEKGAEQQVLVSYGRKENELGTNAAPSISGPQPSASSISPAELGCQL